MTLARQHVAGDLMREGHTSHRWSADAPCCCCAVPGPVMSKAVAAGRGLGAFFASTSRTHSADEADVPDRVETARDETPPVILPRRATSTAAE